MRTGGSAAHRDVVVRLKRTSLPPVIRCFARATVRSAPVSYSTAVPAPRDRATFARFVFLDFRVGRLPARPYRAARSASIRLPVSESDSSNLSFETFPWQGAAHAAKHAAQQRAVASTTRCVVPLQRATTKDGRNSKRGRREVLEDDAQLALDSRRAALYLTLTLIN
jgi:hypothetical protein